MKRKVLLYLSVIIISFAFLYSCGGKLYDYEEVETFFMDNKSIIESISADDIPQPLTEENKQFIIDKLGKDTIVGRISLRDNGNHIVFECGVIGGTLGTENTGFYYSKDSEPYGLEFDSCQYSDNGNERIYDPNDGVSFCKTIKIIDNWYYYYLKWY